ncbi:unnamed protein product [marine sediment metagenome]|uniref:Phage P1-related protein n=1 Tax=marine sediment metagenome TaxID=412755 RepID=X1I8S9_9ZZZZ
MVEPQLPPLVEFGGDWPSYEDELYSIYMDEIVNGGLTFQNLPISCQYRPPYKDKHFGFWHVITEGPEEGSRTPDFRRCERIRWIPWMVWNATKDSRINWWENKRGSDTHIVIWLVDDDLDESFAVILAKRSEYLLLKSAYCVKGHRKETFKRERDQYKKANKG